MKANTHSLVSFTAGCTLGGILTGLSEGLYREVDPLYSALLYGTLWTLAGLGGATAIAVLRRSLLDPFAIGAGLSLGLSALVLMRFIALRDLLEEAPGAGLTATAIAAAAAIGIGGLGYTLMRVLSPHARVPTRLLGTLPTVPLALFIGWVAAQSGPPGSEGEATANTGPRPRGVILVVADTLRADSLGAYGGRHPDGAPVTPHLDQLASSGIRYADMSAQASWTKPAMASLLTSLHPSAHRTMSKQAILPSEVHTLAEVLKTRGVRTAAVVTNYNLEQSYGFGQGFDHYAYLPPDRYLGAPPRANRLAAYNVYRLLREKFLSGYREARYFYQSGAQVNERGFQFLDSLDADRPFFLWLHYMEPHDPYFTPDGTSYARVAQPHPGPEMAAPMHRAYQDDVRRLDAHIGELLAGLKRRGLDATTTVMLTSDHGEEFAEHGGFYHGVTLYEEQLRLPLLLKGPALAPRVDPTLARQVDIAPTIAGLLKVPPSHRWEGRDLLGDSPAPEVTFAEEDHQGNRLSSARQTTGERQKLILANPDNPRGLAPVEVYRLSSDPTEQSPTTAPPPSLREALNVHRTETGSRAVSGVSKHLDGAAEAELRSLGYIQ